MSDFAPQILHVDDDQEVLDGVNEFLTGESIPDWGAPEVTSITDFDQALEVLEKQRVDLIILDVRLGGHDAEHAPVDAEEEGVRTITAIKQRRFLPVLFWTGLPAKVEHLTGPLVHAVSKDEGLVALGDAVETLFATDLPRSTAHFGAWSRRSRGPTCGTSSPTTGMS